MTLGQESVKPTENKRVSDSALNVSPAPSLSDNYDNLDCRLCVRVERSLFLLLQSKAEEKGYPNMGAYVRRLLQEGMKDER